MVNLNDYADATPASSADANLNGSIQDEAMDTNTSQQGQTVFKDTAQAQQQTEASPNAENSSIEYTKKCTIADTQTPILVLFGPSQCGKSMTLVRLARYLRVLNYSVEPRRDFLPSDNTSYQQRCDAFNKTIDTYEPLPGNDYEEYMLCTVLDQQGNSKFQILEGPGEHYFSLKESNPSRQPYPFYFNQIKNSRTPKTWCFFLEPNWAVSRLTHEYVSRIKSALSYINLRHDRIVFLYNKVDKMPNFIKGGKVNLKAVVRFASQQYPGLFEAFKENRLFFKWFTPYMFAFVPFSTGDFSGGTFVESHDRYPAALLKVIKMR